LRRAYQEFEEVAVQGARKIVEGKLQAMNHSDEKNKQIYVFNRIFFSITQDTPLTHSLDKGEELIPTGTSSNTDLLQLSELMQVRPDELHLLHTVLVFFRGYRIIAQTILPGLLSSELNNLTQYGSVDDNKSISNNPQFHLLLLPICQQLHLDDHVEAFDKDDKTVEVAISPEIKGICSSNGQRYLCDLQRLAPRDLNFQGPDNEGCVLRPELIRGFRSDKKNPLILPINPNIGTSIRFKKDEHT
jgi:protein TIF31